MTLPQPEIQALLAEHFVVGWRNIEREKWCGLSHGYSSRQTALGTTNGAGGRNVQLFILAPDLTVLHALAGFWHPDDLRAELSLAQRLFALYRDTSRSREEKLRMARSFHDQAIEHASAETLARSEWQSFDRSHESWRAQEEPRDTVRYANGKPTLDADGRIALKPLYVLQHERLKAQLFQPYARFDVERFVDYGLEHYDNNRGFDRSSKSFSVRERLERDRLRKARLQGS
ncbi:MAG: hypothetical protein IPN34_18505 [Planctomycetes bacterium]|nr:hypothetical protein [Planctomycetota bacterium]